MNKKMWRRLCCFYNNIYSPAPYHKNKTVSFLIYKNKIVSIGVNSERTSPLQNYYRRIADVPQEDYILDKEHSEINCLKKVEDFSDWAKAEIVVISKKKDGNFRLARPCKICEKMIVEKGIKNIYYSTNSGGAKYERWGD